MTILQQHIRVTFFPQIFYISRYQHYKILDYILRLENPEEHIPGIIMCRSQYQFTKKELIEVVCTWFSAPIFPEEKKGDTLLRYCFHLKNILHFLNIFLICLKICNCFRNFPQDVTRENYDITNSV